MQDKFKTERIHTWIIFLCPCCVEDSITKTLATSCVTRAKTKEDSEGLDEMGQVTRLRHD